MPVIASSVFPYGAIPPKLYPVVELAATDAK
jgi:hypothetical protein